MTTAALLAAPTTPEAQVFIHVLGAITLFGATGAVAVLALAARGRAEQAPLARASYWTLLVLALPAWLLTVVFGSWVESAGDWPEGLGWLDLGAAIGDAGLLVLLLAAFLAFRWQRGATSARLPTAICVLTSLYLVALAVAWWVMSTKTPS
jgi:hypothetical protein